MAHHVLHLNKEFKCDQCAKTYNWPQGLKDHKSKFHKQFSVRHYCEATFSHSSALRHHVEAKHEVATYSCKYCKYTSTYSCKYCKYTSKKNLNHHVKTYHKKNPLNDDTSVISYGSYDYFHPYTLHKNPSKYEQESQKHWAHLTAHRSVIWRKVRLLHLPGQACPISKQKGRQRLLSNFSIFMIKSWLDRTWLFSSVRN